MGFDLTFVSHVQMYNERMNKIAEMENESLQYHTSKSTTEKTKRLWEVGWSFILYSDSTRIEDKNIFRNTAFYHP